MLTWPHFWAQDPTFLYFQYQPFASPVWFLREFPFPLFLSLTSPRSHIVSCLQMWICGMFFLFLPCLPTALEKPPTIFDYHFCPWLVSWLTSHGSTVTVSTPASPANASSFSIPFDGSDGILVLGNERTNWDYGYLATFNGAEV